MSIPTLESLKCQAVDLGLTGSDITSFCLTQQHIFRDERAAERAAEKDRIEAT